MSISLSAMCAEMQSAVDFLCDSNETTWDLISLYWIKVYRSQIHFIYGICKLTLTDITTAEAALSNKLFFLPSLGNVMKVYT